jgi:hypothetical protein
MRSVLASGAVLAGALTGVSPAQAVPSAPCGYDVCLSTTNGSATLYFDRFSGGSWTVCDDKKDGFRAKATVRHGGQILTLEAAGGWGDCSSPRSLYPSPLPGQVVSLKVWVQDGPNGSPRHPRTGSYTW